MLNWPKFLIALDLAGLHLSRLRPDRCLCVDRFMVLGLPKIFAS